MAKPEIPQVKVTDQEVADLIDEAALLKKQVKKKEERLTEIKATLSDIKSVGGVTESTKFTTPKDRYLTISVSDEYTEPSPIKVRKILKEKGLAPKFPYVVKVVLQELKKFLSDEEIKPLREKTGNQSKSFTFGCEG